MKTLYILLTALLCSFFSNNLQAQQVRKESFEVSGNCGMCKKTIEQSAKKAGANFASWDKDSKKLTVKYGSKTKLSAIQQEIAAAGYDNAGALAPDTSYQQLPECCQYERKAAIKSVDKK
ncbi:cation transporter [Niabella terrae]